MLRAKGETEQVMQEMLDRSGRHMYVSMVESVVIVRSGNIRTPGLRFRFHRNSGVAAAAFPVAIGAPRNDRSKHPPEPSLRAIGVGI